MTSPPEELREIHRRLSALASRCEQEAGEELRKLVRVAEEVGKAWSGSWMGYHSLIYYAAFQTPPPGDHFSLEWGPHRSTGDWRELAAADVRAEILSRAGEPDLERANELRSDARDGFKEGKDQLASVFEALGADGDRYVNRVREEAESIDVPATNSYVRHIAPTQMMSRDSMAINQGLQTPPHISLGCSGGEILRTFACCEELASVALKAASHLERTAHRQAADQRVGTNVFIGHGRSPAWRELKDFVQDRLDLPWDEFNRVPVAGITNIARLSEMLDAAAIALIIMTAEDEQADGAVQARMNVIHEAGLFQGRLGFTKAIVLLEDGCQEFSNIQGLGQIQFPAGRISAAFEEVREVLEREGLL